MPYLFSDVQNMYDLVVLVCTVNVYIPASLGRRPIFRYQVLQVQNCTHFTYSLRTDSDISCREYCKKIEINTAIGQHLLSAIFIARYFKYGKLKNNLIYSLRFYFYLLYLGGFLMYFVSCQTNRRDQTSPKVPIIPGT